uniref:RUNX1/RUNX1T1 fusion protein n=1 Tax=Homo sapiens TaxID=9606 RepID=A0A023PPR2_HUMAN|nr:RUNX1/RUNX1T1 fusion protein [Homo sapiens]
MCCLSSDSSEFTSSEGLSLWWKGFPGWLTSEWLLASTGIRITTSRLS